MNNEIIEIQKSNAVAAYNAAREAGADSTMKVLEALFGKDMFKPKDVAERVKTFEDAVAELGDEHPLIIQYREIFDNFLDGASVSNSRDIVAYLKLRIICAALNEGWEPKFTEDEVRWFPWFWLYTQDEINNMDEEEKQARHLISTGDYETESAGFVFADSYIAPSRTRTTFGSRLCLKSEALAVYCGKQFIDLWADFSLIRRR